MCAYELGARLSVNYPDHVNYDIVAVDKKIPSELAASVRLRKDLFSSVANSVVIYAFPRARESSRKAPTPGFLRW